MAELLALMAGLAKHHGDQPIVTAASLQRDVFTNPTWIDVIVAEVDGALVGYAALTRLAQLYYGRRGMDVHHFFVTEASRNRGIGSNLLRAVMDHATAIDCHYLTVSTQPGNPRAAEFYLKSGFKAVQQNAPRFALALKTQS